jgi:NitT/TauT family transport system substrate-binding protein
MQMRIAVADFVTNTCFPLLAAEELGFFKAEGLDAHVELITPATKAMSALREGATDAYAGGSVHAVLRSFPAGKGSSLLLHCLKGFPGF